ncbi:hypothetical protein JCM10212_001431 [Sporobolomyces blumeae]
MSSLAAGVWNDKAIADTKHDIRIMKQLVIVWFTVLLWDTISTFPSEYKYIWKASSEAKWTPLKLAFLINRYWTVCAQASTALLLLAPIAPSTCNKIFWGFATDGISIMFFCDCIVAIRVYAVYERSRKILVVLATMLFLDLGMMIGAASQLRPVVYPPQVLAALDFKGCAAAIPNSEFSWLISILYWSPPLLFNGIALGLILNRNLELSKQGGRVPILQRMLRDGLFFFLVIMAANLINVVFAAQSNLAQKNYNVPAALTLTSLMASRLVLSLHQHNHDVRQSMLGAPPNTLDRITSNPRISTGRPSALVARSHARRESCIRLGEIDPGCSMQTRSTPRGSPRPLDPSSSHESLTDKSGYGERNEAAQKECPLAASPTRFVSVLPRVDVEIDLEATKPERETRSEDDDRDPSTRV